MKLKTVEIDIDKVCVVMFRLSHDECLVVQDGVKYNEVLNVTQGMELMIELTDIKQEDRYPQDGARKFARVVPERK
jgi:hypothetical protein